MNIYENCNISAQKYQGRHFSEVAEAPQAATTRRTGLGITIWCQKKTLSKNSGAKPCQSNILSKSCILTLSDGMF